MDISFHHKIKTLDGQVCKEITGEPPAPGMMPIAKEMTLESVCCSALLGMFQDEQNLPGEEKVRRFKLAMRIHGSEQEPISLDAAEVALIQRLISKMYAPLIVGRAYELLDHPPPNLKAVKG